MLVRMAVAIGHVVGSLLAAPLADIRHFVREFREYLMRNERTSQRGEVGTAHVAGSK